MLLAGRDSGTGRSKHMEALVSEIKDQLTRLHINVKAAVPRKPAPGLSVLSLGAGVQSSTLALMLSKGYFPEYKIDCAIFADTGAEPKSVYDWLDWLETQLKFPVYRVAKGSLTEDSLELRKSAKTGYVYLRSLIPMFTQDFETGKKGVLIRKCTRDYKIEPIQSKLRDLVGREGLNEWRRLHRKNPNHSPIINQLIGISSDEVERIKPSGLPWVVNHYPLINLRVSRSDCKSWMRAHGFPTPPRSACRYCPFRSDDEWQDLKLNEPKEFEKAVRFERAMQALQTVDARLNGQIWLHNSCKPLDQIDFGSRERESQLSNWGNECEGMCGL